MMRFILTVILLTTATSAYASGLEQSFVMSAAGMRVQSERMKIVSQNIANIDSTSAVPGGKPYRRKTITFENRYDPKNQRDIIQVKEIGQDYREPFQAVYDPAHPAADEKGYVLKPNVKSSIERLDLKEAERGYNANLGALETSKRMYLGALELLR